MGKYLIALGIWLSTHVSFFPETSAHNSLAAIALSPLSYRWMNALFGSSIPLVVIGITRSLGAKTVSERSGEPKKQVLDSVASKALVQQRTFALLAGTFIAVDGLFITESRYALINIYMVFFGLLGHWLWLQARHRIEGLQTLRDCVFCLLAGISLGASVATKWNGLGFLLGLFIWDYWQIYCLDNHFTNRLAFTRSQILRGLFYGIVVPSFTYVLIWWPHLLATDEHFAETNAILFNFHHQLNAATQVACSKWYTWPLLIKPFAYWYEEIGANVHVVSNIGNPILWWLSSAAILLLGLNRISKVNNSQQVKNRHTQASTKSLVSARLSSYLLLSYCSNWLPWAGISRCTYLYLYMPAAVFSFMAVAWLMSGWLHSSEKYIRMMGWLMLSAIALAFWFWIPLALGSPLTPEALKMRWWLSSWI